MINDDKANVLRQQLVADYEDYLYELTNEEVLAISENGVFTRQECGYTAPEGDDYEDGHI